MFWKNTNYNKKDFTRQLGGFNLLHEAFWCLNIEPPIEYILKLGFSTIHQCFYQTLLSLVYSLIFQIFIQWEYGFIEKPGFLMKTLVSGYKPMFRNIPSVELPLIWFSRRLSSFKKLVDHQLFWQIVAGFRFLLNRFLLHKYILDDRTPITAFI